MAVLLHEYGHVPDYTMGVGRSTPASVVHGLDQAFQKELEKVFGVMKLSFPYTFAIFEKMFVPFK